MSPEYTKSSKKRPKAYQLHQNPLRSRKRIIKKSRNPLRSRKRLIKKAAKESKS